MAQKVSRKKLLKDTDEFLSLSARGVNWMRDNRKWAYIIAASFVFILVAFVIGRAVYNSNQNTRRLAFQEAVNLTEQEGSADQAIVKLNEFLKKYGGSDLGPLARLSLGSVYYDKSDYPQAVEQYEKAMNGLKDHPEMGPIAAMDLASAYQANGQGKQAIDTLTELEGKPDNYLKEETLYHLARLYHENGDKEKARETGEKYVKEYPDSPNSDFLKNLLGLADNKTENKTDAAS